MARRGRSTGTGAAASDTAEIYEPPYLFKGPRPTIGSAPATIKVGAGFGVETPDTNVTSAVLVAPWGGHARGGHEPAPHSARPTRRTGCVDLAAPPNANAAPPGYYMLFLLNDKGVPSVAKFVKLSAGGAAPAACPQPAAAGGSAPVVEPPPGKPEPPVVKPPQPPRLRRLRRTRPRRSAG